MLDGTTTDLPVWNPALSPISTACTPGDLRQELVDGDHVYARHDRTGGLPGRRAGRRHHVAPVILGLPHAARPRDLGGPDPRQRPLLVEPGLVGEPDLDPLPGMGGGDQPELLGSPFLNASW